MGKLVRHRDLKKLHHSERGDQWVKEKNKTFSDGQAGIST